MSVSSSTVYLISGANRGIGLALVKALILRPSTIVFAGARDPSKATELGSLASDHPDSLYIVKLVSGDVSGNKKVVEEIKEKVGRLDVVIANAGINQMFAKTHEASVEMMKEHFEVNTLGPLVLFQSTLPLLLSPLTKAPKFSVITSIAGSVELGPGLPFDNLLYGSSKAAVNWFIRRVHEEWKEKGLIVLPLCPGLVDTDLTRSANIPQEILAAYGCISPEESASGLVKLIEEATIEKDGGIFRNVDGTVFAW